MKYTKEIMEEAVKDATSIAQVCRNLGIKPLGGNYQTVKKNLKKFEIDVSHFTGQKWNKDLKYLNKTARFPLEEVLQKKVSYKSNTLKKRLIAEGIKEYKCEVCGYTENLELHHINGDHYDNRIENLQILCPNCHAKTPNYRGRNSVKSTTPELLSLKYHKNHYCTCKNCQKEFYSDRVDRIRKFCSRECYNEYLNKIRNEGADPLQENGIGSVSLTEKYLKELVKQYSNLTEIANHVNISRTTVRNYLIRYGLYEDFKLKYDFHSIPVVQYDMDGNKLKEFPSISDAASFVGLKDTKGITKCCKGKRRSAGGYLWRFLFK